MRRVLQTFTEDEGGKRAAEKLMRDHARLLTNLGFGKTHGVYVDKTLPKGHPKRKWAPWGVFVSDRKSVQSRRVDIE
jgi:hypothetical protein